MRKVFIFIKLHFSCERQNVGKNVTITQSSQPGKIKGGSVKSILRF